MATTKVRWFKELDAFKKKILSKKKFSLLEFEELIQVYIESVKFFHFKNQIKWAGHDPDIDLKLRWVYEFDKAIKLLVKQDSEKK